MITPRVAKAVSRRPALSWTAAGKEVRLDLRCEDVEVGFDEAVEDDKLHHIWTVLDAEGELAIMPGRH